MTHQERDRLGISLVSALVIHVVIIVGISFADWEIREYPESTPVFVELIDYQSTPPVPEPVAEEPEPVAEPEPEPEPVEPEPTPEPEVTQTTRQEATAPRQATQSTAPTQSQSSTDAPPGTFTTEDLPWLQSDASDDRGNRTTDAELFTFDEVSETGELPAWVAEGAIQPLTTLAPSDQEALVERERDVEFQRRLDAVIRSVDSDNRSVAGDTWVSEQTPTDAQETGLPGASDLEWVGGGTRRAVGTLALPDFDAEDFGGDVPARLALVVVFDVNADGLVVPGSLILRSGTGYTRADQKVRGALSRWRFEPAPGSRAVTAICTLIIERDEN